MWLDAVLAVIFVLSTAQGYRMGFLHTLIHTAGWLASLILGFLWYPKVAEFLREKTDFYNIIYHKIQNKMGDVTLATHDSITDSFPKVLKNAVETVADTFTSVSYTHLDVYKRQVQQHGKCQDLRTPWLWPLLPNHGFFHGKAHRPVRQFSESPF